MMRVVLDTNVLVSGIAKWRNPRISPPRILRLWDSGAFELGVSTSILRELDFALAKSYFQIHSDTAVSRMLLDRIKTDAVHVDHPAPTAWIATHWQDDRILETALEGHANYLVTGDKELLALDHPFAFRIVHPNAFLAVLEVDKGGSRLPSYSGARIAACSTHAGPTVFWNHGAHGGNDGVITTNSSPLSNFA